MTTFKLMQQAPDFTLSSVSGEKYTFSDVLKQQDNQWHLIIFFRGSWCPACMSELQELEESKGYFEKQQIHLMTVTYDEKDSLEKMVQEHGFTFPVLIDENLEFLKAYGVHFHDEQAPYEDHGTHGEPAYFLMDETGKVLYQQRQTSPFGRPNPKELRKIIQYIKKNLK